MGNLAVIPARGGSKRIPRKNVKHFLGKPIIAYSIAMAIESGLFSEVMVSTDDREIADIAISYGATVPFIRSSKNADDYATTFEVLTEVTKKYEELFGKVFDSVCCIYPTSPLTTKKRLIDGFNLLSNGGFNSVFPVVAFSYPIWRGLRLINDKVVMAWPEHQNSRSQDLEVVYHDAGQWYWFKPAQLTNSLFSDNSSSIVLSEIEVQDIDTDSDWRLAELKYTLLNE